MKKYSHAPLTKFIVFILMIACFTGAVTSLVNMITVPYNSFLGKSYFQSHAYLEEALSPTQDITSLLTEYKSEEHILNGGTISDSELNHLEEELFYEYDAQNDYTLTEEDFKEEYAEEISLAHEKLIQDELRNFHRLSYSLESREAPLFYATDGDHVYSNTTITDKEQFEAHPAYFIMEDYKIEVYPTETNDSNYLHWIMDSLEQLNPENMVVYLAFTEEFLTPKLSEWEENSQFAAQNLFQLTLFIPGFIFLFIYLALLTGRRSFKDKELKINFVDKLYTDVNILLCLSLIWLFIVLLNVMYEINRDMVISMIIPIAMIGFTLILSLVKHIKNKTFFKHSLIYVVISKLAQFISDVYRSGNVGVKTVLIVIGYPILIAVTWFMFPVTIGIAAWFAFKKVKAFKTIQDGVGEIKSGNLHHRIDVADQGEFATLAENINTMTDGLNHAVDSELKSGRLKTELITNVSHDIRTPLTSIITYVDLLKQEEDPLKIKDYVEILDQKAKRLKSLTDDLFDAAKASSGDIPVQLGKIDLFSLITQGLGEVADKIEENKLQFKVKHPEDKVYVTADGRLLWRAIENLLSNIFKYTLEGSRVYIDLEDVDSEIRMSFKNISATELNMTADELMERFKRGDESRTTEGSGLGLSIAESLIELQNGHFSIQIDGDLFKVVIELPKYVEE